MEAIPTPDTPWVGLIALAAMFVLPFVPNWLFEGPRTIRHRPRRHVCADCGAPWTDDHDCGLEPATVLPPLRGELHRPGRPGRDPRPLTGRGRRRALAPRPRGGP